MKPGAKVNSSATQVFLSNREKIIQLTFDFKDKFEEVAIHLNGDNILCKCLVYRW